MVFKSAMTSLGFPSGSDGKESAFNTRGLSLIPGLGRSLGGGNGNPLQYSCLENPMDREFRITWWVPHTVYDEEEDDLCVTLSGVYYVGGIEASSLVACG